MVRLPFLKSQPKQLTSQKEEFKAMKRIRKELSAFALFVVAAFGAFVGYAPRPVLVRLDKRRR
jgi:hypothetical protein